MERYNPYHYRPMYYDLKESDPDYGPKYYDFPSEVIHKDKSRDRFDRDKLLNSLSDYGVDTKGVVFKDKVLHNILGYGDPESYALSTDDIKVCIEFWIQRVTNCDDKKEQKRLLSGCVI